MLYLDNAATGGYKPTSVLNAVNASLKQCANPGRSGHRLSLACAERVLACRMLLSELFGGYSYERVIFTRSCTEALNIALFGVLERGDHVVTTCLEHNSVLRPLEALKQSGIIEYDVAPLTDGKLTAQAVLSLVRKNTRLVAVTAASNVTGEAPDLAEIRRLLPPQVLFVVDGAQGGGHLHIHMQEMGIDALALAGHKGLFAMQGAAALLLSERMNPKPLLCGGTGSESISLNMPAFFPDRLEAGTLSYPAICSLFEGALFVKARRQEHYSKLIKLTSALSVALSTMKNYRVFSKPNGCGILSFSHRELPSEEVAGILSEKFDIAVRGGLHCAPLVHQALGTSPDGLVRVSFSPEQTQRNVETLLRALRHI